MPEKYKGKGEISEMVSNPETDQDFYNNDSLATNKDSKPKQEETVTLNLSKAPSFQHNMASKQPKKEEKLNEDLQSSSIASKR